MLCPACGSFHWRLLLGAAVLAVVLTGDGRQCRGAADADRRSQPARRLKRAKKRKEVKRLTSWALAAADEVFAKVVVPKLNQIIPEQIKAKGDDPMEKVVNSKSLTVTDLAGLSSFQIESITSSSLDSSMEFLQGLAETATAHMELVATVAQPMNATGTFVIGKKGAEEERPRRLGFVGLLKRAGDSAKKSLEGASGTYQMKFTKVKINMPMTGSLQISAGTDLTNVKDVMQNLKHVTIRNVTNSKPHVSVHIKLECSPMDIDCHTANAALAMGKPMIDYIIGDHAESIVQNILDKALPKTLGEKTEGKASGTVSGEIGLATGSPHLRRLQALAWAGLPLSTAMPEPAAVDYSAADANVSDAIAQTLAGLGGVSPGEVTVNMSRSGSAVNATYSITVSPEMKVDAYNMTYSLLSPTVDELGASLWHQLDSRGEPPYSFNVTGHAVRVLDPVVSTDASGFVYTAWTLVTALAASITITGLLFCIGVLLSQRSKHDTEYDSLGEKKKKRNKRKSLEVEEAPAKSVEHPLISTGTARQLPAQPASVPPPQAQAAFSAPVQGFAQPMALASPVAAQGLVAQQRVVLLPGGSLPAGGGVYVQPHPANANQVVSVYQTVRRTG